MELNLDLVAIRHISFDFWNTLALANKNFGRLRNKVIQDVYGISEDEVKAIIKAVKADPTSDTGLAFYNIRTQLHALDNPEVTYLMAEDPWFVSDLLPLIFNRLYRTNLPYISPHLIDSIRKLKEYGISVSLNSNTCFVPGKVQHEALLAVGTEDLFDVRVYSDETGHPKPAQHAFRAIEREAEYKGKQILHVGDNKVADFEGATKYGFQALLVADPTETLAVVTALIKFYESR